MKYQVTGDVVRFAAGQALTLNPGQIDARRHALEIVNEKKGMVIARGPVEFKRGEEIDLKEKDEDLPRSLSSCLTPATKAKPVAKNGAKADAGADDLDALEEELDAAERALLEACEKHGLAGIDRDAFTDEQKALIVAEAERLEKAKAAYVAAVGE